MRSAGRGVLDLMMSITEWIAVWLRRSPVFAELIRSHPEVVERLHALIRFCEAKPWLLAAQSARAVGYLQSPLYAWESRFDGDPVSFADRLRRKTAPQAIRMDARGLGGDQGHAHLLRLGHREALEDSAQGWPSGLPIQRRLRGAGTAGERRD